MMLNELILLTASVLTCVGIFQLRNRTKAAALSRLNLLAETHQGFVESGNEIVDWANSDSQLANINTRFGKAGFFTESERISAKCTLCVIVLASTITGGVAGFGWGDVVGCLFGILIGLYLGAVAALYYLRLCIADLQRRVSFLVPLVLESLILLVEAGLGILPAVEKLVARDRRKDPVIHFLGIAYGLAANGVPFGEALKLVADATDLRVIRHVFLHLDISGNEGGELIPSLRSLSNHAHMEWKLSVEQRVKRLENFVVFPVFCSVIGLMLLIAAVPIIPVLDFHDALSKRAPLVTSITSSNHRGTQ